MADEICGGEDELNRNFSEQFITFSLSVCVFNHSSLCTFLPLISMGKIADKTSNIFKVTRVTADENNSHHLPSELYILMYEFSFYNKWSGSS